MMMKKITIATVLLAAFSAMGGGQASLASTLNEGYITDSAGNIIKDGNGECARNAYWTPAMANPACKTVAPPPSSPKVSIMKKIPQNDGYLLNSVGNIVNDSNGECARNAYWTLATANPACKTVAPPPSSPKVSIMKKDPLNDGYLVDAEGKITRDAEGKCVHTAYWTPSMPACDAASANATHASTVVRLEGTNFATNSAKLLKTADGKLNEVVNAAKQHSEVKLYVSGYTDNRGKKAHNQKLSENRAAAVKAWLVKHGIAAGRIDATGYADTQPIADNKTKAGRAANRRVEVRYTVQQ